MELENKYSCYFDIISITFDYYNGDNILEEPKLIFLCRIGNFNENKQELKLNGYEYFKLIFIKPSTYSIYVRTTHDTLSKQEMLNPQKIYDWAMPIAYEINKIETEKIHSHWEITFTPNSKEKGYISVYADDLKIEKIK